MSVETLKPLETAIETRGKMGLVERYHAQTPSHRCWDQVRPSATNIRRRMSKNGSIRRQHHDRYRGTLSYSTRVRRTSAACSLSTLPDSIYSVHNHCGSRAPGRESAADVDTELQIIPPSRPESIRQLKHLTDVTFGAKLLVHSTTKKDFRRTTHLFEHKSRDGCRPDETMRVSITIHLHEVHHSAHTSPTIWQNKSQR